MSTTQRVILRADLAGTCVATRNDACVQAASGIRRFTVEDGPRLGALLFEAYLGTIDQEEDTLAPAQIEIDKTIAGVYGPFLPACSMVAERAGELLSATLVTRFRGRPFIAFSFTDPASKNQGLARACIEAAMAELLAIGEHEVHLVVTVANAPALHLYRALGFEHERDLQPTAP